MSPTNDEIPSLTLRVLQNIQAELVGMRGDIAGVRQEVHTLNDRFDHFLTFVGRDIQDLKLRVTALETERRT